MATQSKLMKSVLKGYLYQHAARDAQKLLSRAQDVDFERLARRLELKKLVKSARNLDLDFDRERLLHRIGLAPHRPGQHAAAGIGLFAIGLLAGGACALALAPKKGEELREDVKLRAKNLMGRAQEKFPEATHGAPMA
jgi:hypothetical protein